MTHLYHSLASHIATSINAGIYRPGDRLPGVRVAAATEGVSASTVVAAYRRLETDGYVEARPRSGYFVRPRMATVLEIPRTTGPSLGPEPVNGQDLVLRLIQNMRNSEVVQLGASIPDASLLPIRAVSRAVAEVARQPSSWAAEYEMPPGLPELRGQIARRMSAIGCITRPDDVVITSGCQEALYIGLKSVTSPGDVVAIESPAYYGLLQTIDALGLKALEIPTDPDTGISVEGLQLALEEWPVRACVVVANFSNPLGSLMPDDRKAALVNLIEQYQDVVLIEDDIYGDTHFDGPRPGVLKALDRDDRVIHCASFSKTLSPALRLGWVVSSRYRQALEYQKFVTNCATSSVSQMVVAKLLANGTYERHLRSLRLELGRSFARMADRLTRVFPAVVKLSRPRGGLSLWVELPRGIDTTVLAGNALARGISIAPGAIFSSSPDKYRHCFRVNCAIAWSPAVEGALATLGGLVQSAIENQPSMSGGPD